MMAERFVDASHLHELAESYAIRKMVRTYSTEVVVREESIRLHDPAG
jgi:hypothetical protein